MIHTERSPMPQSLQNNADGWAHELCNLWVQYYQYPPQKRKQPHAVKSRYASKEVKQALKGMFGGKCCYCEAKVEHVSYRHVEHFRPQSVYPKLAYKWSNLLFACERCNCEYKSDKFPLLPNGTHAAPNKRHPDLMDDTDANMLINPCDDDPLDFYDYKFIEDSNNDYFDISLICKNQRSEISRDVYGLNRSDLTDDLRTHLRNIHNDIRLYNNASNSKERQIQRNRLLKAIEPSSEYTAMTRAYICNYHKIDL